MTEMVTSGSMSGDAKRSDGLLGESGHERRRSQQARLVLHATARVLDSTSRHRNFVTRCYEPTSSGTRIVGLAAGLLIQAAVGTSFEISCPWGGRNV